MADHHARSLKRRLPEPPPRNGIDTPSPETTRARRAADAQNGVMFRTAARLLLLRFLPRRILPIVTIAEAILLIRSVRRKKTVAVNDPAESRTAPPGDSAGPPGRGRR
jgi:hypothetical protein